MQTLGYTSEMSTADKEVMADHIVRLLRLIPTTSVKFVSTAMAGYLPAQQNQYEQHRYFKAYDIAFYLLSQFQGNPAQHVEAAVDVVELVKKKIEKEQS